MLVPLLRAGRSLVDRAVIGTQGTVCRRVRILVGSCSDIFGMALILE
jgi:hypothetical protein